MRSRHYSRFLALLGAFLLLGLQSSLTGKTSQEIEPLSADDLAAKTCRSYPEASAEILLDRLIHDTLGEDEKQIRFRRLKVYDAGETAKAGLLGVDYSAYAKITAFSARILKQDGRIIERSRDTAVDTWSDKLSAPPMRHLGIQHADVVSGDVVELSWTLMDDGFWFPGPAWYCQSHVPVRHFAFEIDPGVWDNFYRLLYFNVADVKLDSDGKAAIHMDVRNQPPFQPEPFMPPEHDLRGWFQIHTNLPFRDWTNKREGEFMERMTSEQDENFRLEIAPNRTIKDKAVELVRGLTTDDEKLGALYEFTRTQVKNLSIERDRTLTVMEKSKMLEPFAKPAEVLAKREGESGEITRLFASLAKASGFEVHLAISASRQSTVNVRQKDGWIFLRDRIVAVRAGQSWRFFTPGSLFVPAGMVRHQNEGVSSLIYDRDKVIFETNPIATAEKSPVRRTGRFHLDKNGSLEGTVTLKMGGHAGASRKERWLSASEADITENLADEIKRRIPSAIVTDVTWENLRGPELPLIAHYTVKVPDYAKVKDGRLNFAANFFEQGAAPVFTANSRKYPILFDYARSEHDDIEIELPEGFSPDVAGAPQNFGDVAGALGVRYQIGFSAKSHKLVYKRDFALGGNGVIAFPVTSYPGLKQAFDAIRVSDAHTLSFKLATAAKEEPVAK